MTTEAVVRDLAALGPGAVGVGGKARGLGALVAAGLPVPPGFVLTQAALDLVAAGVGVQLERAGADADAAGADTTHQLAALADRLGQAEIPTALAREVEARVAALGPVMVRSSFALEDGAGAAGPGVFTSIEVTTAAALWPAIRAVWLSALTPAAIAYARRHGGGGAAAHRRPGGTHAIELAVVIQRRVPGRRTTVYTRPPGQPDADEVVLGEVGHAARRLGPAALTGAEATAVGLARAAAQAIAAPAGADVELVHTPDDTWWLVQARPIIHPAPLPPRQPAPPALLAPLRADNGTTWQLDLGHNPDPLSPAQRALVAAVDAAAASPARLCTVAGYLYVSSPAAALGVAATDDTSVDDAAVGAEAAALAADVAPIEAALAAALTNLAAAAAACTTVAALPAVIAAYVALIRTWSHQLSPRIAAARHLLRAAARARAGAAGASALLIALTGPRRSALGAALAEVVAGRRGLDQVAAEFADVALAWDVAAPTLGEQPQRLLAVAAAIATPAPPPPPTRTTDADPEGITASPALATLATLVADLGERDDLWFARAQAGVRRALRQLGQALELGDDVFWLDPAELAELSEQPARARGRAAAARAANERARAWHMPRVVRGGSLDLAPTATDEATSTGTWHGQGGGGQVVGAVARLDRLDGGAVPRMTGMIVVAPAATPALALALVDARALVCATGGLLDHGAAMARELGLPYVVGCAGAWDELMTGELIAVDGDAGTVRRL